MKIQENKQKAIELAYGEYWDIVKDYVYENGWCDFTFTKDTNILIPIEMDSKFPLGRPKSLSGIETNNNWTVINSDEDLPKENMQCFIMQNGKIQIGNYISNYKRWFAPGCYYSETYKSLGITHYQLIKEPSKPIY